MSNRRIQVGQPFTIRIPRNAPSQVIRYLEEYRENHTLGFGKHVLYLVQKGMEAEGLIPSESNTRPGKKVPHLRNGSLPELTTAQQTSTDRSTRASVLNSTPETSAIKSVLSHINLSNFE